jgi:hypothetical protein
MIHIYRVNHCGTSYRVPPHILLYIFLNVSVRPLGARFTNVIFLSNLLSLPCQFTMSVYHALNQSNCTRVVQYWPKVTHAMKHASHVGCNACNARVQRVLHRICYSNVAHMKRVLHCICYSNVAHMKRASSVQHPRNIRTTFAQHSHNIRTTSA